MARELPTSKYYFLIQRASIGGIVILLALFSMSVRADFAPRRAFKKITVDPALIEQWRPFEGKIVNRITFSGLERSKERAIRWLLRTNEGAPLSVEVLAVDLQRLYNTSVLYEISPRVVPSPGMADKVDLEISLKDKWTLLPIAGAIGGGGSLTYGAGLYDSNLGGYFVNALLLGYNYNGIFSYVISLSQEYIAGTPMMGQLALSDEVTPVVIHHIDGSAAGQFVWRRHRERLMWGYHFDERIRLQIFADHYRDSLSETNGVQASVYSGSQYRLEPRLVLGRVNFTDYLENGAELTLRPSSANFLGSAPNYQSLEISYKSVFLQPNQDTLAIYLNGSVMSPHTPPPYQFQVGGYSNVRGYIDSRQVGPYMFHANFEYRPLLYTDHWEFLSLDLVAIQGCVFTDVGSAWGDAVLTGDEGAKQINPLWSVGAGVRLNLVRFAGATARLDVARTIRPDEGWGMAFGVGQFF
jgi:hypothetical protein